jgi:predicted aspartyl protease
MGNRARVWMTTLVSVFLFNEAAVFASQTGWEIPIRIEDRLIMVEASIGQTNGLKFLLDTGASNSLVDKKLVKRLGLKPEGDQEFLLMAFGQMSKGKRVLLPGLHLGSILASMLCFETDLAPWGVDGIIGLDFLRRKKVANRETLEVLENKSFTIDFESGKIQFGCPEQLEYQAPLVSDPVQIVVGAKIQGQSVRLAVDTGARSSVLFNRSHEGWLDRLPVVGAMILIQLGGKEQQCEVTLPSFQLGTDTWSNLSAIVVDARNQSIDGVMAVAPLKMKVLHIDFERALLTWKR